MSEGGGPVSEVDTAISGRVELMSGVFPPPPVSWVWVVDASGVVDVLSHAPETGFNRVPSGQVLLVCSASSEQPTVMTKSEAVMIAMRVFMSALQRRVASH
jgi:hypothetical protein